MWSHFKVRQNFHFHQAERPWQPTAAISFCMCALTTGGHPLNGSSTARLRSGPGISHDRTRSRSAVCIGLNSPGRAVSCYLRVGRAAKVLPRSISTGYYYDWSSTYEKKTIVATMALGSSLQVGNKVRDEKNCHGKKYINLGFYGVWKNFLVCYTMEKENNFPKFIFSLTLS